MRMMGASLNSVHMWVTESEVVRLTRAKEYALRIVGRD